MFIEGEDDRLSQLALVFDTDFPRLLRRAGTRLFIQVLRFTNNFTTVLGTPARVAEPSREQPVHPKTGRHITPFSTV